MRFIFSFVFLVFLLATAAAQSTVFLVRHAEKVVAEGEVAKDPELSEAGRARAKALAQTLRDAGLKTIYVTELKRTQQTAAPVASATQAEVEIVPAKDAAALVAKLKETAGNALVIGHSNTLPEIIRAAGVSAPVEIKETQYDDLFVLIFSSTAPPRLLRLHYD